MLRLAVKKTVVDACFYPSFCMDASFGYKRKCHQSLNNYTRKDSNVYSVLDPKTSNDVELNPVTLRKEYEYVCRSFHVHLSAVNDDSSLTKNPKMSSYISSLKMNTLSAILSMLKELLVSNVYAHSHEQSLGFTPSQDRNRKVVQERGCVNVERGTNWGACSSWVQSNEGNPGNTGDQVFVFKTFMSDKTS